MTTVLPPTGHWLRIVVYSDFHDIPHRVLFIDREFVFWLLSCPFERELDDYGPEFALFRIGHDAHIAGERLRHGWLGKTHPRPTHASRWRGSNSTQPGESACSCIAIPRARRARSIAGDGLRLAPCRHDSRCGA